MSAPFADRPFMPGDGLLPADQGGATLVTNPELLSRVLAWENAKYRTDYTIETLDPESSSCFRVDPRWAFAIREGEFTSSPTRWRF